MVKWLQFSSTVITVTAVVISVLFTVISFRLRMRKEIRKNREVKIEFGTVEQDIEKVLSTFREYVGNSSQPEPSTSGEPGPKGGAK